MKIGLFFGSFNPVHLGHLILSNFFLENTDIDRVIFVVSPQNPFKKSSDLLAKEHRLKMLDLAISDNQNFEASNIEFTMPIPSYTIDTLNKISQENIEDEFILIMGADNIANIKKWKSYKSILENYKIYVYPRLNYDCKLVHKNIFFCKAPLIEISSTQIRKYIKNNKSVKYIVADAIIDYINIQKLYGKR